MKKFFAVIAVSLAAYGAHAAASQQYAYWSLAEVADSFQFSYAILMAYQGIGEDGGAVGDPVELPYGGFEYTRVYGEEDLSTSLEFVYSRLPVDAVADMVLQLNLYREGDSGDSLVGVSDFVSVGELADQQFIYSDLGTGGIRAPYVFTVDSIPEPSGGLLFAFGLAVLALKRRRLSIAESA